MDWKNNKILKTAFNQAKKQIMGSENKSPERSRHAETVIRNHVIFSMGAGFIPLPVADIFAVSASQLDMIRQLCKVYEVDFAETQGKAIVSALTSSTLARIGAGSLAKMIPVVGSIVGGVTNSVLAGASTYALGEVFKRHFETGGTVLDFDTERLKKVYKEKFEKGKKVAQEWKQEEEAKKAQSVTPEATTTTSTSSSTTTFTGSGGTTTVERLKEIAELKNAGIITDEEFQEMKKKIINNFN